MMRDFRFDKSIVLALLMSSIGASGCDTAGVDSVTGTDIGGYGVGIEEPTYAPTYSTVCDQVLLAGSVTASGGSEEGITKVTVTWTNETTGNSGQAVRFLETCYFLDYPYDCLYWAATVSLILGENVISVTAADASNHRGQRSLTVNKSGPSYAVSGKIVNHIGIGLGYGIKIELSGGPALKYAYTREDGSYSFSCVVNGSYSLRPSSPIGYSFSTADRTVTVTDASVTGQDFTAEAYVVSGTVNYADGSAVNGAPMTLTAAAGTFSVPAFTGHDGAYRFVVPNGAYVATPSCALGCVPASRAVTVDRADVPKQDFTAAR